MSNQKKNRKIQSQRSANRKLPYAPRGALLSAGERRFFHEGLKPAVGERFMVSFKVRLADVITVKDWEGRYGRKIAQKHLDFVLLTPKTTRIAAVIELNDATHDMTERQRRDEFLRLALDSAYVPFTTFPIYRRYDPIKIRRQILAVVAKTRRDRRLSKGQ